MAKIVILITLLIFAHDVCRGISSMQGQEANMIFPYPCDTEVTLQHLYRSPFYNSTEGLLIFLPDSHAQRFEVKNVINNGSCSLNLTIRDLMIDDEGTYILFVYKDGEILSDPKHMIHLKVDYPPDKAICDVGEDYDREWVAVDCTANARSLPGKIECYQDGLRMPHLRDPAITGSLLKQSIIIRKSEQVYCCYSTLNEDKSRCECDDIVLFQDEYHRKDPCPTISTQMSHITSVKSTDYPSSSSSTTLVDDASSTNLVDDDDGYAMKLTRNELKLIILGSCMISVTLIIIAVISIMGIYYKRMNKHKHSNVASKYPSKTMDNDNDGECAKEKLNPNREFADISGKLKTIDMCEPSWENGYYK